MCLNVALSFRPAPNKAQELSRSGVFFSKGRDITSRLDYPFKVTPLRLHFTERHESGFQKVVDRASITMEPEIFKWSYDTLEHEKEWSIFREEILKDTPASRAYWALAHKATVSLAQLNTDVMHLCTRGKWALVPSFPPEEKGEEEEFYYNLDIQDHLHEGGEDGYITMGQYHIDGYGCFLGYGLPITPEAIKVEHESSCCYSDIYRVRIPYGTKYVVWVRCSDTGKHSGALIMELRWYTGGALVFPRLMSTFSFPHIAPEEGHVISVRNPEDIVEVAEYVERLATEYNCDAAERGARAARSKQT